MKTARTQNIQAKIQSEGYCCIKGYLGLCKAREEKVPDMAENIGLSKHTIYYHIRKGAECQKQQTCMQQIIHEVEKLVADEKAAFKPPED